MIARGVRRDCVAARLAGVPACVVIEPEDAPASGGTVVAAEPDPTTLEPMVIPPGLKAPPPEMAVFGAGGATTPPRLEVRPAVKTLPTEPRRDMD